MKLDKLSLTVAAALALGLASCSKNEPATPAAGDATKVAGAITAEAASVADAAKAEAAKAAEAAKSTDNSLAQGLIDKARGLIAEGKYADAASILQQLTGQTLSADQTTLVASLKEQIQKALAAKATENAAGSVGNLLKK